jgi:hypothetical protein
MKKIKLTILTLLVVLALAPLKVNAETEKITTTNPTEAGMESARAQELLKRLDQINALDKSAMNSSEKKENRKEVRAINKELKQLGGGVYISVGAILIILLLLIILL